MTLNGGHVREQFAFVVGRLAVARADDQTRGALHAAPGVVGRLDAILGFYNPASLGR